jgi:hypothetical protein
MNLKTRRVASLRWLAAFLLVATAAAYCARRTARAVSADAVAAEPAPAAQELFSLERRISVVEQRLNTIELTVNRIEQQARYSSSVPPASQSVRDTELELLRSQVELLQRRVAEDECGLVRLDERTLSPSARDARRKSATAGDDPCRRNFDAPLRLAARQ